MVIGYVVYCIGKNACDLTAYTKGDCYDIVLSAKLCTFSQCKHVI